jgi:hypothetical protein
VTAARTPPQRHWRSYGFYKRPPWRGRVV